MFTIIRMKTMLIASITPTTIAALAMVSPAFAVTVLALDDHAPGQQAPIPERGIIGYPPKMG